MSIGIIDRLTVAKTVAHAKRKSIARFELTWDDWHELEAEVRRLETTQYSGDVTSFLGIPVRVSEERQSSIVIEEKVTL